MKTFYKFIAIKSTTTPKSQRYLPSTDTHYDDAIDILVPESMQNFIHKKLSQIIDKETEFINVSNSCLPLKDIETISNVRLFSDTVECIDINMPFAESNQQRYPIINRRKIIDEDLNVTHKIRLQQSAVTFDGIQNEIKHWKEKKSSAKRLYEYRMKKGIFYLIEPDNEFTKMRKKNNWSESKIALTKLVKQ